MTRGSLNGVVANALDSIIAVSEFAITSTFGQLTLGKTWTSLLSSQLWVK